jgi:glycosyltransferase involved in cell wall biosynthesis
MGVLHNRLFIRLSEYLEVFLYRRAQLITGQTQGIVDSIQSRLPKKPVYLMLNGVNVDTFLHPTQRHTRLENRRKFEFEEKFVVGYAGLHGLAQGLDIIVQSASILSGYDDILFVLFGDGPEKSRLIRVVKQAGLTNIRFYPPQAMARMPEVVASFDVALVPLRRLDLFKGALPTKLFEAMAAAVPLVVSIDGEARQLVERAGAGFYVEPENPQAMTDAIVQLYRDPAYRRSLGQHGQQYAIEHCHRRDIARALEQLLLVV